MYVSRVNAFLGSIIVGMIMLFMNFFYLFEGIGNVDNLYWPFLLIFAVILASNIDPVSYGYVRRNSSFINTYTVVTVASLVAVLFLTILKYGQSFSRTFREVMPYMMFLLAIPMLMYILRKATINGLIDILNVISIAWFILIILQRVIYSRNGVIIFSSSFEYQVRDGIRISLSCVGNLSLIINTHQLIYIEKENRCKFSKTVCILGYYSLFVIQQTRALTFAVCMCFLILVLLDSRKEVNHFVKRCLLIVGILAVVFSTGVVNSFISSFSTTGDYAHSTIVRTEAIDYYLSIFKQNPLFGFGFVGVADFKSLIRGPFGEYFLNDVGIFGQLAKLGLFIIPIYIWPVIHFIRITVRTRKNGSDSSFALLTALCVYMIVTSASVIMIDSARSIGMPIYIAIFEYQNFINQGLLEENSYFEDEQIST